MEIILKAWLQYIYIIVIDEIVRNSYKDPKYL